MLLNDFLFYRASLAANISLIRVTNNLMAIQPGFLNSLLHLLYSETLEAEIVDIEGFVVVVFPKF